MSVRESRVPSIRTGLLGCLVTAVLASMAPGLARAEAPAPDQISQISVINALMLGQFIGSTTLEDLLKLGDFGLGTFDHLDGEMIVLDGVVYQAKADGTVERCPLTMTTPFAVITPFDAETELACPPVASLEQLEMLLEPKLPSRDVFLAIRIDATFDAVRLRAVPKQEPPFRPLSEVVKEQSEWERTQIPGTMVGIRCPKWTTGISVPGYHWHFISDDRKSGGHVFDCRMKSAKISFDRCRTWVVKMDESLETQGQDLSQDLSEELEQVERQRGASENSSSD